MKVLISTVLLMVSITLITSQVNAQNSSVAIGDATPKANAVLYLKSPGGNQGLIIPIVGSTGSFGEAGMIVFNSADQKVHYHNGTAWTAVGSGTGSGSTYTLSIVGNNLLLRDATSTVSTVPLAATAPTAANQFLTWDGSKWVATAFTQDAANVNGAITVNGIKGKTLPALPSTTQALVYNGTAWVFQALTGAGSVTNVATGTGLTGGPITTTGTISVDVGTTANKIVQLDGTGKLPAVDGSQLTNLPGGGDITGVTAGTGLAGGGPTGTVTLNLANTAVAPSTYGSASAIPQITVDAQGRITNVTPIAIGAGASTLDGLTDATVSTPASGQVLVNDGSGQFRNVSLSGDVSSITATGVVTNTPITSAKISDGTIATVDLATGAVTSSIIADGSILAGDLNAMSATNGQVLKFNGTTWAPGADDAGVGATPTLANGQILTGNGTANTASALSGDATLNVGVITISNNAITSAKINDGVITGADLATNIAISTTGNIAVNSPGTISGIGSGLTAINATNVSSGSLALARITPGTNGDVLTTIAGVPTWQASAAGVTALDGLSDATVATPSTGQILVNDGAGQFRNVSMSGDATIGGAGAVLLSTGSVSGGTGGKIVDASITSADLAASSVSGGTGGVIADASITNADIANVDASKITTGILPVSVGGTGRVTWSGLLLGAGATINDISTGAAGQVLTVVGTTPSWQTPTSSGWGLTGNTGTTPATNFIGTDDAQDVAFRSNDVEVMRITPSGNMGIGIAAPTSRLHLHNAAVAGNFMKITNLNATAGITIGNSGIGGREAFIVNNENAAMYFQTNALNRMAIDAVGNIGMGIIAPTQKLDVVGNVKFSGALMPNDLSGIAGQVLTSAGPGIPPTWVAGGGSGWGLTGNALTTVGTNFIGTTDNVGLSFRTNNLERIRVLNTGDVGIGTITPSQKLDVVGNITIGATNSYMIGALSVMSNQGVDNILVGGTNGVGGGARNSIFGTGAGANNTGADNTFIGRIAGAQNTSGINNVMVGKGAGQLSTTGNSNTFVGFEAGSINTAGQRNTIIGGGADVLTNNLTNASAFGYLSAVNASNAMVLGSINGVNGSVNDTNVGIGTTAPTQRLDVVGNLKFSGALMPNNLPGTSGQVLTSAGAGAAPTWITPAGGSSWSITGNAGTTFGTNFIGTTDNVNLSFKTNNLQRMAIDNLGRVQIDANPADPTATFTGALLDLVPNGSNGVGNLVLRGSKLNPNDPVDIDFRANDAGSTLLGRIYMNGLNPDMYLAANGSTPNLTIYRDGKIGIGTNTPHAQLQLASSVANRKIVLYEAVNNDHEFIGFGVDGTGALRYQTAVNSNDHIFYTATSATTSNELMRITGTGNVGIGTTTPTRKLSVQDDNTAFAYAMNVQKAGTSSQGLISFSDGANTFVGGIAYNGATVSYNAFTGSHLITLQKNHPIVPGTLLTMTGEVMRKEGELQEPTYEVRPSTSANDSRVMGAYFGTEPQGENLHLAMAVGNGEIWVIQNGEDLKQGDYLISSDVEGHAMKDKGEFEVSYIVGRVAEDVKWDAITETVDGKKHKSVSVFFESFARNNKAEKLEKELNTVKQDMKQLKEEVEMMKRILNVEAKKN